MFRNRLACQSSGHHLCPTEADQDLGGVADLSRVVTAMIWRRADGQVCFTLTRY